jgi:hypothetical protein
LLAAKLRITAHVLGCASGKALVAKFHAANPATSCEVQRLYKWIQGRALPRRAQFYADWAQVIGSPRSGAWMEGCTLEAFITEMQALHGADAAHLESLARADAAPPGQGPAPAGPDGLAHLQGVYACYSLAWSPFFRGQVIRGTLRLAARPNRPGLVATYSEALGGAIVEMPGEVVATYRAIHVLVRDPGSGLPIFFSLVAPGPPAVVLCGSMSGVAFVAHETLCSAGRVIAIRLGAEAKPEASNAYLPEEPGRIAADLRALGIGFARPEREADEALRGFLAGNDAASGLNQVSLGNLLALSDLFDLRQMLGGVPPPRPLRVVA